MGRTVSIALAFVGLLVGAGFATGAEVIQYFISFGTAGLIGAVVAGIIFAIAGAIFLTLGSYFMAEEHNFVFRNVSHPIASRALDISVTITLFAIGFVMLAGAGANLSQQFGWPAWVGSLAMTILVMVTGLFDVDRVSKIISALTPFIIIAVIVAFIYTMMNIPEDLGAVAEQAANSESPVSPWWLSALNYNGLALILGLSMCLVIGGNNSDPKAAFRGGLAGGILYTVLLIMAAVVMLFNFEAIGESDVPMLQLFESIHPVLATIMVWIIFGMIYNTAIGMFYALGRRLAAGNKKRYTPIFLGVTLAGFAISFFGFDALMTYVYPVLGYMGMIVVIYLAYWWFRHRGHINSEAELRERATELIYSREHPDEEFTKEDAAELERISNESQMDENAFHEAIHTEVATDLHGDDSVDYEATRVPDSFDYADADTAGRETVEVEDLERSAAEAKLKGQKNFGENSGE
ncbi:YkvI family membrane protein [Corynebacterium tapiri]|uniref:YkvI family membrane protein n=1 Tax=Corynebacterium tapiri TaxID=1448266 RepID=UPI0015D5EC28|nr:hypothetical protein [Corynebacterium tapiri]